MNRVSTFFYEVYEKKISPAGWLAEWCNTRNIIL